MAKSPLRIWLDGSSNVNERTLGGAATTTNGHAIGCSFIGSITGAELSEHVGVTCALRIAFDAINQGFDSFIFHVDSDNCWRRYQAAYGGFKEKFAYLRPVWQLNKSRIQELERRGCVCTFHQIDRSLNTEADDLARSEMHHAIQHGVRNLTHPDGTPDEALQESLNLASSLLLSSRLRRARSAPNRDRASLRQRPSLLRPEPPAAQPVLSSCSVPTADPPDLSSSSVATAAPPVPLSDLSLSWDDFWQKMKRRTARQLLVNLAGVELTRGQQEVASDYGLFRVVRDYDGREVQGGYLPVTTGDVVDIHPGSTSPGDTTNRHEHYVFGWLVDSTAKRLRGGWLPLNAIR